MPIWVSETASPLIVDAIDAQSLPANVHVEADKIFVGYESVAGGSSYVAPSVMLATLQALRMALSFPLQPRVMHAERTFWEKATAIHVFCLQERLRGERFSRHWHDIVCLDDIGIADRAIDDRDLAKSVAQQKSMFFSEKATDRTPIYYEEAVGRGLRLTPSGEGRAILEQDYAWML